MGVLPWTRRRSPVNYQCPKCAGHDFVLLAPAFNLRPGFLWLAPRKVRVGYFVRCSRHACTREWCITRAGASELAANLLPGRSRPRVPEAPEGPKDARRREDDPEADRTGVVQRPEV